MKTLKNVMSLALVLVMVIGALVVLPTEVKAAPIATLTSTADENAETGKYGFNLSTYCSDYVDGADYTITVVLSSDGAAGSFGGGVGAATQLEGGWTQLQWSGNGATTTVVFEGEKLHEDRAEVQVWWLGEGNSVSIESISVVKKTEGSENTVIHTFLPGTEAGTADGAYTINLAQFNSDFVEGKDYVITVKLSSDAVCKGVIGCCSKPDYSVWVMTEEQECSSTATWSLEVPELYGSAKVEIWYMGGTYINIDEITVVEKVAENPNPNPNPDDITPTGDVNMVLPLVLVLFGGAIVVVAFKKRFA